MNDMHIPGEHLRSSSHETSPGPGAIRLLLVEDNPGDVRLIRVLMSTDQAEIVNAERLHEAAKLLHESHFDAVLLDLNLPDSNGMDTVHRILELVPQTPIIVLTGLDDEVLGDRSVDAGAHSFLVKGQFDGMFLRRTLRHAIERQRLLTDLADENRARRAAQKALEEMNNSLEARVTERTAALRASEERYRRVIENVGETVYMVEMAGGSWTSVETKMFVSPRVEVMIGRAAREFEQNPVLWMEIIHPDDRVAVEAGTRAMLDNGGVVSREYRVLDRRSGEYRWLEDRVMPQFDADGRLTGLFGVARDITERRFAESEMRKLSTAVEQTADSVMITNPRGVIEYVNTAFETITGYSRSEAVGALANIMKSGRHDQEFYGRLWSTLRRGEPFREVFVNQHKNGALYYEEKTISPLKDAQGGITHFVSSGKDITARIHTEERLHHLAYHDTLTGLPNRVALLESLDQAMMEANRHERLVAVLFLDLDRFKNINDTLGHTAGDQLLIEAGKRLKLTVRQDDTVARTGGDEFVVVLADVAHFDDVPRIAHKIQEQFSPAFRIAGQDLFITPSIGIALYPADGDTPVTLLKNADAAMYHAKESGRNAFRFFTRELNQRVERQMAMEMALRQALDRNEFLLHFQPQVDLSTGGVLGMEALIRWKRGAELVSPLEFIPIAEDTGLIVPIGEWVLRSSCAQAAAWQRSGLPAVKMSVNLSARQFHEEALVSMVKNALEETGLDPQYLVIEITESGLMNDPEAAREKLEQLHALGIHLAVDDFGTGYSSLSYLKRFPIDSLKIDKSFVRDITMEPDDAAIAQAIISMSHSLGIKVVAEGVENEAQLGFLRTRGCDAMQGYYFSKPLPCGDMTCLLQENRRLSLPVDESMTQARTLLIVDDEENIRKALVRALRSDGYRILTADGPMQAFELLAQYPIGVILSDQRMPEMSGVEFLSRVKNLYPQTVRIVLSGYTDLESITNAINRGAVYKFLTKPWEDDLLREHLREAFRHYQAEHGESGRLVEDNRSA